MPERDTGSDGRSHRNYLHGRLPEVKKLLKGSDIDLGNIVDNESGSNLSQEESSYTCMGEPLTRTIYFKDGKPVRMEVRPQQTNSDYAELHEVWEIFETDGKYVAMNRPTDNFIDVHVIGVNKFDATSPDPFADGSKFARIDSGDGGGMEVAVLYDKTLTPSSDGARCVTYSAEDTKHFFDRFHCEKYDNEGNLVARLRVAVDGTATIEKRTKGSYVQSTISGLNETNYVPHELFDSSGAQPIRSAWMDESGVMHYEEYGDLNDSSVVVTLRLPDGTDNTNTSGNLTIDNKTFELTEKDILSGGGGGGSVHIRDRGVDFIVSYSSDGVIDEFRKHDLVAVGDVDSGIPNVFASEGALIEAIDILNDKVPDHTVTQYRVMPYDLGRSMQELITTKIPGLPEEGLHVINEEGGGIVATVYVDGDGEFMTPSVFFDIGSGVRAKVTKRDDFWEIAFMEPDPNSQGDLVLTYSIELAEDDEESRLYKFGHISNGGGVQIDTTEELLYRDELSVQATTETDKRVAIDLYRHTGEKFVRLDVNEVAGPAVYWYENDSNDGEGIDQLINEAFEIVNNPPGFNDTDRYKLVSESWVVNDGNNRLSYYNHHSDTEPNYHIELIREIVGKIKINRIAEQLDVGRDVYTILTQRLVGDDQIEVSVSTDSGVLPLCIHLDADTGLILSVDIARQEGGGFDDDDYDDDDYDPFTTGY